MIFLARPRGSPAFPQDYGAAGKQKHKSEIRISKSETNPNDQNSKAKNNPMANISNIRSHFVIVSGIGFRILNFIRHS
jgi:hypothetical protein